MRAWIIRKRIIIKGWQCLDADLPQWASELGICCHACGQQPDRRPFSASLWGCFRSPAYSHVLNDEKCFVRNVLLCTLSWRHHRDRGQSFSAFDAVKKRGGLCVCVCMCVHCLRVHCRCLCMEARGQPPMIFLRQHPACLFVCLRPGLTVAWSSPRRLGWLTSEPRDGLSSFPQC